PCALPIFYSILDFAEGAVVKGGISQYCDGNIAQLSGSGIIYPASAGKSEWHLLAENFNHVYMLNADNMSFCIKSRDDYLQAAGMTGMKIIEDMVLLNVDLIYGNTEPIITFDFIDFVTADRSEEHTSELQSRENLVCRLLLEKKKKKR